MRPTPTVTELDVNVDLSQLSELFEKAWTYAPWTTTFPTVQSGVSVSIQDSDEVLEACGGGMTRTREQSFNNLARLYSNSCIQEIIGQIPFQTFRWRWMILFGKSCYSLHKDHAARIQIPLYTSTQAAMVFREPDEIHHLEVGKVYLVDTTRVHSAFNGDNNWRVHLVGCL